MCIMYTEHILYITMFNNRLNHHFDVQIDQGTLRHVLNLLEMKGLTLIRSVRERERERAVSIDI